MKKIIIALLAIIFTTKTINAQLKVDSIGNVAIATTSTNMNAKLRVGSNYYGNNNWTSVGIAASPKIKENAKNIGVCGASVTEGMLPFKCLRTQIASYAVFGSFGLKQTIASFGITSFLDNRGISFLLLRALNCERQVVLTANR